MLRHFMEKMFVQVLSPLKGFCYTGMGVVMGVVICITSLALVSILIESFLHLDSWMVSSLVHCFVSRIHHSHISPWICVTMDTHSLLCA